MPNPEHRAPLEDRLDSLARTFLGKAWENEAEPVLAAFLRDHAYSLSEFAQQVREEYERVAGEPEEEIPTNAQGIALARFLRPAFRDNVHPGLRTAHVARGGAGLPEHYLHVVLPDGYEGGIDRDGRTST